MALLQQPQHCAHPPACQPLTAHHMPAANHTVSGTRRGRRRAISVLKVSRLAGEMPSRGHLAHWSLRTLDRRRQQGPHACCAAAELMPQGLIDSLTDTHEGTSILWAPGAVGEPTSLPLVQQLKSDTHALACQPCMTCQARLQICTCTNMYEHKLHVDFHGRLRWLA